MPEGQPIYAIEMQIYRPDSGAFVKVKNVGVITVTDQLVESDLTNRDGTLKLAGGILREIAYEFELGQRRDSPDRTFFYNAYKNRATIELLCCDTAKTDPAMIGIRGPFRVLQCPPDGALEPQGKRKIVVKPTLDDEIPFQEVSGAYAGTPTELE